MAPKKRFRDPFLSIDPTDSKNFSNPKSSSDGESESSDNYEEKRLKIAKNYIKKLKVNEDSDADLEEVLNEDLSKKKGAKCQLIAENIKNIEILTVTQLGRHRRTITCLSISQDGKFAYTGSKEGSVGRWDIENKKRLFLRQRSREKKPKDSHTKTVLAVTVSFDGRIVASAGEDLIIFIWECKTMKPIHKFNGHRESISGLVFSPDGLHLYSSAFDRTLKSWNIKNMAYIETLFGHDKSVNAIDSFENGRLLSCSSDQTARVFKTTTGTQLIFKTFDVHSASLDCCCFVGRNEFLLGSQDGGLSLWTFTKKKPLFTIPKAHGGSWICSVASLRNSDLIASGAANGSIKLWKKVSGGGSKLVLVKNVSLTGFINTLEFSEKGRFLIASASREHRLGRWEVTKNSKNTIHLVSLKNSDN